MTREPTNPDVRRLVRRILNLQREVSALARASQARYRSLEGGSITVYDPDSGVPRATIGQQPDGSYTTTVLNGTPPPVPSDPLLNVVAGGVAVTWDGRFRDDVPAPADFRYLEVHAAAYTGYVADNDTQQATLSGARGGTVLLPLPAGRWYVSFVAVSESGAESSKTNELEATTSVRVLSGISVEGVTNLIEANSGVTLAAGTTAPAAAPGLTIARDTVQLDTTTRVTAESGSPNNFGARALNPANVHAFGWHDEHKLWLVAEKVANDDYRFWRFTTAGRIATTPTGPGAGQPWVTDTSDQWAFVTSIFGLSGQPGLTIAGLGSFDQTGTFRAQYWNGSRYVLGRLPDSPTDDAPVLGYDPDTGDYLFAENYTVGSADAVRISRMYASQSPAAGQFTVHTQRQLAQGTSHDAPLTSILAGSFDLDVFRFVWATRGQTRQVQVAADTGLADYDEARRWPVAGAPIGLAWDGSRFHQLDTSGRVTEFAPLTWADDRNVLHVAVTAYRPDPGYETTLGGRTSIEMVKRAQVRVTMPTLNSRGGTTDPTTWRFYATRTNSTTAPADSAYRLQGAAGSTTTQGRVTLEDDVTTTGGTAPTVSTFPNALAAWIRSAVADLAGSLWQFNGDGSWRLGHLAGTATGGDATDSGWVTYTGQAGDAPFAGTAVEVTSYRRRGNEVRVRVEKLSTADLDVTTSTSHNYTNRTVVGSGLPSAVAPERTVQGVARFNDVPVTALMTGGGVVVLAGGPPVVYTSGDRFTAEFRYDLD